MYLLSERVNEIRDFIEFETARKNGRNFGPQGFELFTDYPEGDPNYKVSAVIVRLWQCRVG